MKPSRNFHFSELPSWFAYGFIRLLILLPYPALYLLGKRLGDLYYWLSKYRRQIALTNIQLCFADKNNAQQQQICRQHFQFVGVALIDTAINWWGNPNKLIPYIKVNGLKHLSRLAKDKKPVIILSFHFTALEAAGHYVNQQVPFATSYQRLKNPLFDHLMTIARERNFSHIVDRNNVREMIRTIRKGLPLWIAPDQDQGRKKSVFVPFFGQQTATQVGPMKLSSMTNAVIIPAVTRHFAQIIQVDILPPLENFPSQDMHADALRINQLIEKFIKQTPEQYLWTHRRFKTRPNEDDPSLYPDKKT